MRDLLVAGGGPIGLATACTPRAPGLDVVVREPRAGPIDKACGEGLMPSAVVDLTELGVVARRAPDRRDPLPRRTTGAPRHASAAAPGSACGVRPCTPPCSTESPAAAVPVIESAVDSVVDRGDHLLVDGEPTRYLIAADGLHSRVRRLVGLDAAPATLPPLSGSAATPRSRRGREFVEVHWAAAGEAYVTPVADGQVGVALLSAQRRSFDDLIGEFPALAERLAGRP